MTVQAQSSELREAVRVHDPEAQNQARAELRECLRTTCPSAARLSLLEGYLLLSAADASAAAGQLLSVPAPIGLESFHAYYLAEALAYSGEAARAQRGFAWVGARGPPWLAERARGREAELLARQGRWVEVLLRLETLSSSLPPELLALRAQALGMLGRAEDELADLRTLLLRWPAHPAAAEALPILIARMHGAVLWTLEERITRARHFVDAGAGAQALTELDEAGSQKLARGATAVARLALVRAGLLLALGRDADAQKALDAAQKGVPAVAAEALMTRARRTMRGSDLAEARKQMAEVERRFPKEAAGVEAGFLAGWLDLQRGELAAAAKGLTQYADHYPRSPFRDDALWFAGLAELKAGRPIAARAVLQRLTQLFPRSSLVPQARYWAARALQLPGATGGDPTLEYTDLPRLFPGSLYALFATERLRELHAPPPVALPPPTQLAVPLPASLKLGATLAEAALLRDAGEELQWQVATVRGAADALTVGHALQRLGEYGLAHSLAARALWGQGFGERRPEALALFFPRPFATTVQAQAAHHHISPFLVYAVMRRESGFQADRMSPANARGLMQVIPPTARAISEQLRRPAPLPDELFAPALNLELGAWYLGRLWQRFQHPALVAAAYNAGPQATMRWTAARGSETLDLFIEEIPYKETRGYVKQVVADYFNYFDLYAKPGERPAWTWTLPKPPNEGISF